MNAKEVLQEFTRKIKLAWRGCVHPRCCFLGIFGGILLARTKTGSRTATFGHGPLGSGDLHSQKLKHVYSAMRALIFDAQ